MKSFSIALCAVTLCLAAWSLEARAQPYPSKPLHLVVGLPAGGGADAIARLVAEALGEALGQQVIVENRPGSGGLIAAESVTRAPADGYTILFGGIGSSAVIPAFGKPLGFDPVNDLAPVSLVATVPVVLVVGAALPVGTLRELLDYGKARAGGINYASAGNGSSLHLSMEMLKAKTGLDATHVPYKGGVQAIPDLLSGQIHAMFEILPTQIANIKAGKVRALAIGAPQRNPQIPDVPTMAEAGVADFDVAAWFAVFVPARTPSAIVDKLNTHLVALLRSQPLRERLARLGVEAAPSSPAELRRFQEAEIRKWAGAIRVSGVALDWR